MALLTLDHLDADTLRDAVRLAGWGLMVKLWPYVFSSTLSSNQAERLAEACYSRRQAELVGGGAPSGQPGSKFRDGSDWKKRTGMRPRGKPLPDVSNTSFFSVAARRRQAAGLFARYEYMLHTLGIAPRQALILSYHEYRLSVVGQPGDEDTGLLSINQWVMAIRQLENGVIALHRCASCTARVVIVNRRLHCDFCSAINRSGKSFTPLLDRSGGPTAPAGEIGQTHLFG